MFLRISCFLCALVVSSGVFAQDAMTVVERPQGIKNPNGTTWQAGSSRPDQKGNVVDNGGYNSTTRAISVVK